MSGLKKNRNEHTEKSDLDGNNNASKTRTKNKSLRGSNVILAIFSFHASTQFSSPIGKFVVDFFS
jgi:hypothetical protein